MACIGSDQLFQVPGSCAINACAKATVRANASGASQATLWRCGMLRSQVSWRLASWRVAAVPVSSSCASVPLSMACHACR